MHISSTSHCFYISSLLTTLQLITTTYYMYKAQLIKMLIEICTLLIMLFQYNHLNLCLFVCRAYSDARLSTCNLPHICSLIIFNI